MSKILLTEAEIIALADKAREWLNSSEGKAAMKESMDRCKRVTEQLREDRIVPWETLHREFTI